MMKTVLQSVRWFNDQLARAAYTLSISIVALMVTALFASALTRYLTGTGYDWLIELPPILIPWLVFPLLGPLLRTQGHINVDVLPALLSPELTRLLRLAGNVVALAASVVFFIAGTEAVGLYMMLGQVVELEIEFPIWYMYLAFPVGFAILASFAIELILRDALMIASPVTAEQDRADRS